MTDLQTALEKAYAFLSSIPVSGDSVEIMAAAREQLRNAFRMTQPEKEDEHGG